MNAGFFYLAHRIHFIYIKYKAVPSYSITQQLTY